MGAKLEVAKFLQDTVSEMAKDMRSSKTGAAQASAADLYQFMKRVGPSPPLPPSPLLPPLFPFPCFGPVIESGSGSGSLQLSVNIQIVHLV